VTPPGALFADAGSMSTSNQPLIVCLSSTDWGFLRYRKQQLMERPSRYADVICVSTPVGQLEGWDDRETAA
jgi:hypothetical protein